MNIGAGCLSREGINPVASEVIAPTKPINASVIIACIPGTQPSLHAVDIRRKQGYTLSPNGRKYKCLNY